MTINLISNYIYWNFKYFQIFRLTITITYNIKFLTINLISNCIYWNFKYFQISRVTITITYNIKFLTINLISNCIYWNLKYSQISQTTISFKILSFNIIFVFSFSKNLYTYVLTFCFLDCNLSFYNIFIIYLKNILKTYIVFSKFESIDAKNSKSFV